MNLITMAVPSHTVALPHPQSSAQTSDYQTGPRTRSHMSLCNSTSQSHYPSLLLLLSSLICSPLLTLTFTLGVHPLHTQLGIHLLLLHTLQVPQELRTPV